MLTEKARTLQQPRLDHPLSAHKFKVVFKNIFCKRHLSLNKFNDNIGPIHAVTN